MTDVSPLLEAASNTTVPLYDGYTCFYILFSDNGREFTNKEMNASEAAQQAADIIAGFYNDGLRNYLNFTYVIPTKLADIKNVQRTVCALISNNLSAAFLGRTLTYKNWVSGMAEKYRIVGNRETYNPMELLVYLNVTGQNLGTFKNVDGKNVDWIFWPGNYNSLMKNADKARSNKLLEGIALAVATIVVIDFAIAVVTVAGGISAMVAAGGTVGVVGQVLQTGKNIATGTVNTLAADVTKNLLDPQTYVNLTTQIIKDNVTNVLNLGKNDILKAINDFSSKSGIDLNAVSTLVTSMATQFNKDMITVITNQTRDLMTALINHQSATDIALNDPSSPQYKNWMSLNTAQGQAFADGIKNLLYAVPEEKA
jgi:hypothetical protein